jgi:hypothetical protein
MIAERYTDYMYDLIERVMKEIGPRESCSDAEKECGRLFASEIAPACEKVETEKFTCRPRAFMGFFPYLVLLYLAGLVLYFFLPAASVVLAGIGILVLFLEVVRYKELIDPLFGKREGENIAGFIRPSGQVARRVYVSGHFDAAYEFNIWLWFKSLSPAVMVTALVSVVLLLGFGLARAIVQPTGTPEGTVWWVFGIILLALSPFVLMFFFFHTGKVVPGAMDDMAAVAVVAGLGKYLAEAESKGEFYPQSTEVVLLGLSSEEAGLRGAKRYVAAHLDDPVPSSGIFLDGIYDEQFFSVFTRELWPGSKLDEGLVSLVEEAADANGFEVKRAMLPLGATDASAFALAGVPSVAVSLWDTTRLVPHYHTRYDTIEKIRPQSLAVALQTVIDVIRLIDAG